MTLLTVSVIRLHKVPTRTVIEMNIAVQVYQLNELDQEIKFIAVCNFARELSVAKQTIKYAVHVFCVGQTYCGEGDRGGGE
jgi:hypothetical protein